MLHGRCLCGAVTIALPGPPAYINMCNCRTCRATGTACGYYAPADVAIEGETRAFERNDIGEVWLHSHFCPRCGSTTHWTPAGRAPTDRMGINMRLFDEAALAGIEVRYQDGRAVETDADAFVTMAIGHIGDGKAF